MITQNDTDQLLDKARAGDEVALESLLKAVQPQIYRFSVQMCRQTEDAEDVLQDSMMALARSVRDFRGASSFSTWLYTVTRSFCIKKRRKRVNAPLREEPLHEQEGLASSAPSPQEQLESAEAWRQVKSAIETLEPKYREVLILRDVEGLRAAEVSEVVGITVSAVKSRLHRARADLRATLTAKTYKPRPGCPDIRVVFSKHLEGELSADICSTMEAHVADCGECNAECDGLRSALAVCSSAPCEVPQAVQERVQAALRSALQEDSSA
jgi:RNA polymerase sigma-70 factor, ECF subfamily